MESLPGRKSPGGWRKERLAKFSAGDRRSDGLVRNLRRAFLLAGGLQPELESLPRRCVRADCAVLVLRRVRNRKQLFHEFKVVGTSRLTKDCVADACSKIMRSYPCQHVQKREFMEHARKNEVSFFSKATQFLVQRNDGKISFG